MDSKGRIAFTSLGMLILDKVHLPSGKVFEDVLGGSGAYASLGARLFSPRQLSKQVGYTIRKGNDFPPQISQLLEDWGVTISVIHEDNSPSTRGELHYLDQTLASKSFKYLTPILPIDPEHLVDTDLLGSRSFHFFLDPSQIVDQTAQLLILREKAGITTRPLVIWEPKAYSCLPENLSAFLDAMRVVDVFSPNHLELARIVGIDAPATPDQDFFESLCSPFVSALSGSRGSATLVVRAGAMGCFVKTEVQSVWLPSYYAAWQNGEMGCVSKVVDTTGAGNTFLGSFAVDYLRSRGDIISAACAGNVGASFAVEQIGMPSMILDESGSELWNGVEVSDRLREYKAKLGLPSL